MGFAGFVKSAIHRFREAGKTENEIAGILEEAAEKSTVNREVLQGKEAETVFEPCQNMRDSADALIDAFKAAGITTEQVQEAFKRMREATGTAARRQTNNWRKMHGLPMRRKQNRRSSKAWKEKKSNLPFR